MLITINFPLKTRLGKDIATNQVRHEILGKLVKLLNPTSLERDQTKTRITTD